MSLLSMEHYAASTFLRNWALVTPYMCSRFHIFDKPVLQEYVSQAERGSHLFQSCFHVAQDSFPPATKKIHPSFESLAIIDTLGLQAPLMDIHQNTSFKFILEDDSISFTSKAHIHFCLGKGIRLWLIIRPSIYSLFIAHSTFTSMMHFCLSLTMMHLALNFLSCHVCVWTWVRHI